MTGILIARVIEVDGVQIVNLAGKARISGSVAKASIRTQGHARIISPRYFLTATSTAFVASTVGVKLPTNQPFVISERS